VDGLSLVKSFMSLSQGFVFVGLTLVHQGKGMMIIVVVGVALAVLSTDTEAAAALPEGNPCIVTEAALLGGTIEMLGADAVVIGITVVMIFVGGVIVGSGSMQNCGFLTYKICGERSL